MSTFEVPILTVDDVYDHPNADRLSILRIRGYEAIANKHPDGTHRYEKGEPVIYVPEGSVVPDQHLQERGYWSEKDAKGILAGSRGNRVKAINLRGVLSQGLVWKVKRVLDSGTIVVGYGDTKPLEDKVAAETAAYLATRPGVNKATFFAHLGPDDAPVPPIGNKKVQIGDDVAEFFGIKKYVPVVPTSMDGLMKGLFEARFDFDIENIKAFPDLFVEGEDVEVTEKLHGTFCRLSFLPDVAPDPELFGDGRCVISTKGMGADGLTFINVPQNDRNLYVQAMTPLLDRFQKTAEWLYPGCRVHLMGEVFGPGVQDLHYGLSEKKFAAFEVAVSDNHGTSYLDATDKETFFTSLGVVRVPLLYRGPYSFAVVDKLASGSTTVSKKMDAEHGPCVREGVVITAAGDQSKRTLPLGKRLRPILKHVSAEYLTRKGGTEYQ